MAILKGAIQMTGGIKGVSFYSLKGSDKIFMRTKGGANKDTIANSPKFEKFRKEQKEFGGCAKFGSLARYSFGGLHRLADYNLTPVLNGMGKNLMKLDTTSEKGRRNLKLTAHKQALAGFNFNRNFPFSSVLRVAPQWQLDRDTLRAVVTIPRINTDIDLQNIQKLPFFRLIVVLGTISDMALNPTVNEYEPLVEGLHGHSAVLTGEWHSTQTILPEHTMTVQMHPTEIAEINDSVTVLLSMAVEFGNVGFTGEPVEVKYAGCGKVIASR
ncbi:MAG: hypothetical protein PHT07_13835 [Paludibacter sp.]|nr:hypothetical protein [Paludibacter sp.]